MKQALIRNFAGASFGRVSILLFRVAQVPLLLSALAVDEFGRWLVLASLPSWLTLANLGFGNVAANEMSMAVAAGDVPRARSLFSTAIVVVTVISAVGAALMWPVAVYIPWERFIGASAERHGELSGAVFWLAITVLLSFYIDIFGGRFRAGRKAHWAMIMAGFRPWLELLAQVTVLQFTVRFDILAGAAVAATLVYLVSIQWLSWRSMPALAFSLGQTEPSQFGELFRKGLAFQAFPIGNALLFQGNLLVVQTFLGPAAVALFATVRTLVRSVTQLMELVNQVIWPELSHLLGAGNLPQAARLHRAGVCLSISGAILSVIGLGLFGGTLYGWWTKTAIALPPHVLLLFLLPIPFNALWYTSSVVHAASNRHEGLAIRYLIGSSLAVLACIAFSQSYGMEGAALSTLVGDLLLIPYVLRQSLVLTGDSWGEFMAGSIQESRRALGRLFAYLHHLRPRHS